MQLKWEETNRNEANLTKKKEENWDENRKQNIRFAINEFDWIFVMCANIIIIKAIQIKHHWKWKSVPIQRLYGKKQCKWTRIR